MNLINKQQLFIVGTFSFLLLLLVGTAKLNLSTEAREAHVTKIMLESGDYILPLRVGHVPSKPPLYHWFASVISNLMGEVNGFTARAPSVLFAALVLLVTISLAQAFTSNPNVGILAGIILSLSYGFNAVAARAMVDMTYSFFVVAAIACIARKVPIAIKSQISFSQQLSKKDLTFFAICCAFAVLGKGPLGAVLPILIFLIFLQQFGSLKEIFLILKKSYIALPIFLMIILPWYVAATMRAGQGFILRQIVFENLSRFFGNQDVIPEPIWYYIPSIARTMFPWSLIFFATIYLVFKQKKANLISQERFAVYKVLLIWFFSGFIIFSLSTGKRHSYLLPLYPAVAIFVSLYFENILQSLKSKKILDYIAKFAVFLISLIFVAINLNKFINFDLSDPNHLAVHSCLRENYFNFLLASLLALLTFYLLKTKIFLNQLYLANWQIIFSLLIIFQNIGYTVKNEVHNFDKIAQQIRQIIPQDATLAVYRYYNEGYFDPFLYFYNGKVTTIKSDQNLQQFCPGYLLVNRLWLDQINNSTQAHPNFQVLQSFRTTSDLDGIDPEYEILLLSCQ